MTTFQLIRPSLSFGSLEYFLQSEFTIFFLFYFRQRLINDANNPHLKREKRVSRLIFSYTLIFITLIYFVLQMRSSMCTKIGSKSLNNDQKEKVETLSFRQKTRLMNKDCLCSVHSLSKMCPFVLEKGFHYPTISPRTLPRPHCKKETKRKGSK